MTQEPLVKVPLTQTVKKTLNNAWFRACIRSIDNKPSTPTLLLNDFYIILRDDILELQKKGELSTELFCSLNLFLQGVKSCIEARRITAYIADKYLKDLIHTGILIQQWQAEVKGIPSHVKMVLRRKSIESDLTKILDKALQNEDPEVKDRFGFTMITYDNTNLDQLYHFCETFTGIITGIFYNMQQEFLTWVITNKNISEREKKAVQMILKSELRLKNRGQMHNSNVDKEGNVEKFDPKKFPNVIVPKTPKFFFSYGFKDYVKEPKENSYQALQCVFELSVSIWDIVNEILGTELMDIEESKNLFMEIWKDDFTKVFADISPKSLKKLVRTITSVISSFYIEGHFKTQQMAENPNATHESHKDKNLQLRKIFTLTQAQLTEIKKKAEACNQRFDFYDSELKDPWGVNHAVFMSPEEHIFYGKEVNSGDDDDTENGENNSVASDDN